jgi:hypothetical protein
VPAHANIYSSIIYISPSYYHIYNIHTHINLKYEYICIAREKTHNNESMAQGQVIDLRDRPNKLSEETNLPKIQIKLNFYIYIYIYIYIYS